MVLSICWPVRLRRFSLLAGLCGTWFAYLGTEFAESATLTHCRSAVAAPGTVDIVEPYPVVREKRYGYALRNGTFVVVPKYDDASLFSEGRAVVRSGNKFGYVDTAGREVVPPQYDAAETFREGLARVKRQGKWAFLNRSGKVVIDFRFTWASDFHEGLARVLGSAATGSLSDCGSDGQIGYIDRTGRFHIPCGFSHARDFAEGLAWVTQQGQLGKARWQAIDKQGGVLFTLPEGCEPQGDFREGLASVRNARLCGFVGLDGEWLIPPAFEYAGHFEGGLAPVKVAEPLGYRWGYVDLEGKFVIEPSFEAAGPFSAGLARVVRRGKWGFINPAGEIVISAPYEHVTEFAGVLATVQLTPRHRGYLTRWGELLTSDNWSHQQRMLPRNDEIETAEDEVIKRYGKPAYIDEFPLNTATDPLRRRLLDYFPTSRHGETVREIGYHAPGEAQRWFWLIRDKTNTWRVFSNLSVDESAANGNGSASDE